MKKILIAALFASPMAFAQTLPAPTFSGLTITGAFSAPGLVKPTDHAAQAANTILANATSSMASPTAVAVPGCSSALGWASGTGFTCNAAINAATLSGKVTIASTGQFYQNLGAIVNRVNDRVFIGAATAQDGTLAGVQDYVSQNIPQGPVTAISQTASYSTQGSVGLIAASRSSDAPNAGTEGSIGVMGVAINDATGANQQVGFAGYFEAQQKTGAGFTAAIENDTANQSGVVSQITPYSFFAGQPIVNLWTAAGGNRSGVSNSSAAMAVLANGASFDKGIVFQSGAISSNEAIALASGQTISWWGNGSTPTGAISSTQATGTAGIVLTDSGVAIGNIPSPAFTGGLFVNTVPSAANYVAISPEPTGFSPQIASAGADANSGLVLNGKGTGGAILQGITSGATVPAGYVGQLLVNSASGVSLTNGSAANLTTVNLTPGSWDLQCNAEFVPASSTTVAQIAAGVGTTSQSLGSVGQMTYLQASFSTGAIQYITTPTYRVTVSGNTTAYCVGFSVFGASTMAGNGYIRATRTN